MGTLQTQIVGQEALHKLIAGNERFVAGKAHLPTVNKECLARLAKAQHPFATILGCSDSRVPPELIFDANFGELFIVRVAGNVISPEVIASIQYAGIHLHTQLFVVLGHERCGAVGAALDSMLRRSNSQSRIKVLVNDIVPGLSALGCFRSKDQLMRAAVEANVRWSMKQLRAPSKGNGFFKSRNTALVGAVFEFSTGRVRFLG